MKKTIITLILLTGLSGCASSNFVYPEYERPNIESRPPCGQFYRTASETKEPVPFEFFKAAWECRNERDKVSEENMQRYEDKLNFINSKAKKNADNGAD